jgi:CHAT domain-containing protein
LALGLGLVVVSFAIRRQAQPLRQRLLAASGLRRPTPGRLAGELSCRPWQPPPNGTVVSAAEQDELLGRLAPEELDGAEPLDRALVQVLAGRTSAAIAALELAAREPDVAVQALGDLAATYLLRFELGGDPVDLLRAVEAADRGLAVAPQEPALLFNRAVALSRLGTRRTAAQAWREVLARESDCWRVEAAARGRQLKELANGSTAEQRLLAVIDRPGTNAREAAVLAAQFPAAARSVTENVLLPRWAQQVVSGDDGAAPRTLQLASTVADELRRSTGDELLAEAVEGIRRTTRDGPEAVRTRLHQGLQDFGAGVKAYENQDLTTAKELLTRAADRLHAVDNPLAYWADFYLSVDTYYKDANRALVDIDRLLAAVPQDRYLALTGRSQWIAGTIDKAQGRVQSAVRRHQKCARALARSGGEEAAAFVSVLLAESYTMLGEHNLAWRARADAFRRVPFTEGARRNIAMLGEAKEALLRQGSLQLAGPLVAEEVAVAEDWGHPLGLATAHLDRAAYRLAIGESELARADLQAGQEAVAALEPSGLKDQMSYLAMIADGLCRRDTDPRTAADLLADALSQQRDRGNYFDTVTYTTALASAQLAAGQRSSAAASLKQAISIFEGIRSTVDDPATRMQVFRGAQPAFDSLVELTVDENAADADAAFVLAERSRSRGLLELAGKQRADGTTIPFVDLDELVRTLPPDVTVVSYFVLDDRLLFWVVERGYARSGSLRLSRDRLANAIDRLRLEVRRGGDEEAIQQAAAPLYEALIRPLDLQPTGKRLIVVPDRWLARLPFAPLFDGQHQQYLIEQRAVTMVPSAALLHAEAVRARSGKLTALAVGVTPGGSYRGGLLPGLRHAGNEAKRVADGYANATLLVGPRANKGNFLRLSVSADVIHFAGHVVVDPEAPGRSALLFGPRDGATLEGVTLEELLAAGFGHAELIVLSACRAEDSVADDRESLLGLAGTFFAAGASAVVASPWELEDQDREPLLDALHGQYRLHRSAGTAFREAILELRRSGPPGLRSPAVWGGLSVIEGLN